MKYLIERPVTPPLVILLSVLALVFGINLAIQNKNLAQEMQHLNQSIADLQQKMQTLAQRPQQHLNSVAENNQTNSTQIVYTTSTPIEKSLVSAQVIEPNESNQSDQEATQDLPATAHSDPIVEHFDEEYIDENWAVSQEMELEKIVGQEHFQGINLEDVECHSASCRMVLITSETLLPHVESVLVGEIGRTLPHARWQREGDRLILVVSSVEPRRKAI